MVSISLPLNIFEREIILLVPFILSNNHLNLPWLKLCEQSPSKIKSSGLGAILQTSDNSLAISVAVYFVTFGSNSPLLSYA